jgi:CcmD family protein
MENWQYLVGAYSVAWLGVVWFILINGKKQQVLEKKIADLEARYIDKKNPDSTR